MPCSILGKTFIIFFTLYQKGALAIHYKQAAWHCFCCAIFNNNNNNDNIISPFNIEGICVHNEDYKCRMVIQKVK